MARCHDYFFARPAPSRARRRRRSDTTPVVATMMPRHFYGAYARHHDACLLAPTKCQRHYGRDRCLRSRRRLSFDAAFRLPRCARLRRTDTFLRMSLPRRLLSAAAADAAYRFTPRHA